MSASQQTNQNVAFFHSNIRCISLLLEEAYSVCKMFSHGYILSISDPVPPFCLAFKVRNVNTILQDADPIKDCMTLSHFVQCMT